jgi:serine protease
MSAEFGTGEALVVLEPAAGGTRGKVGAGTNSGRVSGTPDSVTRLVFPAAAMGRSKTWILEAMPKPVPAGALSDDQVAKLATLLELKELRRRGDVRYAALNRIVHAYDVVPADPEFPRQWWHYSLASLPLAWQVTIGSPDVVVAVADTGIVLSHPDLRAKLVDGYDLVSDPDGWDGDGIDSDPSDAGYCCSGGWVFHGTHVAGTIGASTNNGVGVAGVAWGARLMPVRVLDGRSGTIYDVLQGVRYAAGLANDSGHVPQRRAAIVNVSLGINGECSDLEADLFRQVAQAGVIVVAAAGNAGDRRALSPASCPDVFSVGAAGPNGTRAGYSNYGPHVDLLAPGGTQGAGEGVFSTHATRAATTIEPTYGWLMGTSMAAAHFSGVLALMKSLRPSLTPLEVWQALEAGRLTDPSSGRPATEVGRDDDGYGLLNAAKAVATAGDGTPSEPRLSVAPTSLRFDNFTSTASFLLSNAGSGSLVVDSVRSTVSWATVTRSESNVTGIGRYDVLVTRGDFHRGTRTGTIVVENSAGTQEILLTGTYVEFSSQSRPGNVQVRVVDASTGATVRTQYQASQPFVESFRFDDVPPGKYVIIAGTDMNNDGNLCDPGELCGSYPLGALPDYIDYTGVSVGLEIPIAVTAVAAASAGKDSSGPRAFLAGTPARD